MTADVRVLVVGAGVIGVSVAYHLAAHPSVQVTVCEQNQVAEVGATAKSGGLIRGLHMSDVDLELAARAVPLMRDLTARHAGPGRFRRTGFAFITDEANRGVLEAHVARARQAGIRIALHDRESVRSAHPDLRLAATEVVAVEQDAGYAAPAEISAALARLAADRGVRFRLRSRVQHLSVGEGGPVVAELPGADVEADVVVLANGIWSHHLGATAGVSVPIRSRPIGTASVAATGAGPVRIPLVIDDVLGTYYRPDGDAGVLFGVDQELGDERGSAELDRRTVLAARDALSERVPRTAGAAVVGGGVGFEAYTPDRRPLVGWSGKPGIYLATGMSGGGFKLAAGVGHAVASEIATGAPNPMSAAYRPDRFATSESISSDYTYSTV
ncbi:FAD-binding oxidoreductase [Saccharopolyspora gloriosae]|uniref:Glycine/D-amino acid oxidase-like deaminating enzyme n=1 Tax=Saccharopolyspora gloriosae TaxID=455344 RepID=A0A840NF14_9PSEU|nr:FAD-binding oxidoreductase [Saccharopolyspora gloriosae]MBB5070194.1 glycine/D-amino acid oxidase-like deaminating enzyme [Saccharopolyspora gloriosae]